MLWNAAEADNTAMKVVGCRGLPHVHCLATTSYTYKAVSENSIGLSTEHTSVPQCSATKLISSSLLSTYCFEQFIVRLKENGMGGGGRVVHLGVYRRIHNQTTLRTVNKVPALGTPCDIGCTCTLQLLTFAVTLYCQLFNLRTSVHHPTKAGRTFRGEDQVQLCNT